MDALERGELILGRGYGAMACTVFGALWLGLGLAGGREFSFWVIIAFSICCVGLYAGSVFLIRRGRRIRSQAPVGRQRPAAARKQFLWVVIAEVVACVAVAWACGAMNRGDLIPVGIALVVGLHLLPLAKIVRVPECYVTGAAIVIWCVLSWVLFRAPKMDVSAGIGTGIVLWLTGAYDLIASRALLSSVPPEPFSTAFSK
jgi:hypothetical protein